MRQVIYETSGRAREFNELAINLYTGCGHRCIYCYGADVTHQDRNDFEHKIAPRVTPEDIDHSAASWQAKRETRRVLLCFVTDPYQPLDSDTLLTRSAIEILHSHNLNVHILTKGGLRATRDFDQLTEKDAFATTLTCLHEADSLHWEPLAALPKERIRSLQMAHEKGIDTWVSLEPTIYPKDAAYFVEMCQHFVGHWKVGTMNYHPHGKTINWHDYGWEMKRFMDSLGVKYYFKRDLLREMGVKPEAFKQTWVCR